MNCTFTSNWLLVGQYVAGWLAVLGASVVWVIVKNVIDERRASRPGNQK